MVPRGLPTFPGAHLTPAVHAVLRGLLAPSACYKGGMGQERDTGQRSYEEFDVVEIPEDVPEARIKAGDCGTVIEVYSDGTALVDVVEAETSRTLDMLHLSPEPEPRILGRWRVNDER
jgi:hypothetical protein